MFNFPICHPCQVAFQNYFHTRKLTLNTKLTIYIIFIILLKYTNKTTTQTSNLKCLLILYCVESVYLHGVSDNLIYPLIYNNSTCELFA